MKVFLTGGTGFIGQPLTTALLKRGWLVTALVRNATSLSAQNLSKAGAQLSTGDITDRESMRAAMSGSDIVVHNAGHYEYGMDKVGEQRMRAINVTGTDNVLGLAHELDVPRAVYVYSIQAFGESGLQPRDETFIRQAACRTTYERSKTDAHEIALQHQRRGLQLVIACPNAVVGTNDHSGWGYFLRLYINRIMPPFGWAAYSVHACSYIDDLAEGIALAADKGRIGETYFLSGEVKSMRDHLNYWRVKPGAFRALIWLPSKLAATLFAPLEPLLRMLGLPAFISRESVVASETNWYYVNEKAKRELGWTHRSAEAMQHATIEGELKLLSKRKDQNIVQRLKSFESLD